MTSVGEEAHPAPLDGVRIVDLTSVVAGPYATMWLADLGAEVIKVESPEGDTTRQAGHARSQGMGSVFLTLGRGKRSVCVDLKQPGGREVVLDLCRRADVMVHNMRPEAIRRLGLGHDEVSAVNPAIVHATLAGFGPDGPYGNLPAYDDMIQGLTGMAANLERVTGAPSYVPGVVVDKTAGLVLANAILAALLHRARSGRGQAVTVPLFEATAAFQLVEHLWDATFEPPVGPPGYVRVLSPHRRPFRTSDGWVCALPYQDKHFVALFAALDRPDLGADPRFASIPDRLANIDTLYATLAELIAERATQWWLELFDRIGVPAVRLADLDELLVDPHLEAVGFFVTVEHPTEGRLRLPRVPVTMTDSPPRPAASAPRLGEHTRRELRDIGYDTGRIDGLVASGLITQAPEPQDGP